MIYGGNYKKQGITTLLDNEHDEYVFAILDFMVDEYNSMCENCNADDKGLANNYHSRVEKNAISHFPKEMITSIQKNEIPLNFFKSYLFFCKWYLFNHFGNSNEGISWKGKPEDVANFNFSSETMKKFSEKVRIYETKYDKEKVEGLPCQYYDINVLESMAKMF